MSSLSLLVVLVFLDVKTQEQPVGSNTRDVSVFWIWRPGSGEGRSEFSVRTVKDDKTQRNVTIKRLSNDGGFVVKGGMIVD